jgi:glycosyltransferase involved in cell wall biosynthesis
MNLEKTLIYIPAYNAEVTIPQVFSRMPKNIIDNIGGVLVVDNCSADNTSETARIAAENHGIRNLSVIRNESNLGYGGSQKVGYGFAIDRGFDYVCMLHGDAQYAPELLNEILGSIHLRGCDMVFGSRFLGNPLAGGMPLHRYLGNIALSKIQNLFLGSNLSEFHSGYRVYRVEALRRLPFNEFSSDYHFDTEIIITMIHEKMSLGEIAIPTRYAGEKNYVNIWSYGLSVLRSTISYWLHSSKLRTSSNWIRILSPDSRDLFPKN